MSILFISYTDLERNTSGSGVRPAKMLKAFQELGQEVYALTGEQSHSKERKKEIKKAKKWIKQNNPEMCYIESSTYPILRWQDLQLIHFIHKRGIPMGYFYRDFYRKFPELYPRRKGIVNGIKEKMLDIYQWMTDFTLRDVDIVYVPSDESKKLFSFHDMRELPPAGERCFQGTKARNNSVIYVGGITEHYGFDRLLDTFSILNKNHTSYRLICICREQEWKKFEHVQKSAEWLEVYHASGDGLAKYYAMASVAVIPKKNNEYNQLAVSVKLFEYMSYGLPVVQISSKAMDEIINENRIGIVTGEEPSELAEGLRTLLTDSVLYEQYAKNVRESLLKRHLWTHRAQQVINDLEALKLKNEDI